MRDSPEQAEDEAVASAKARQLRATVRLLPAVGVASPGVLAAAAPAALLRPAPVEAVEEVARPAGPVILPAEAADATVPPPAATPRGPGAPPAEPAAPPPPAQAAPARPAVADLTGVPDLPAVAPAASPQPGAAAAAPDEPRPVAAVAPAAAVPAEPAAAPAARRAQPASPAAEEAPLALAAEAAPGTEDSPLALRVTFGAGAGDARITVSGLPPGARLSAGRADPDGSWTLTPTDLEGLTLLPAENWSGRAELRVLAVAGGRIEEVRVGLHIAPVADAPTLALADAAGAEDGVIALSIAAGLRDLDGSESLLVLVEGVPPGASLTAGERGADGIWRLAPGDLAGLGLRPPEHFSGTLALRVTAVAAEAAGGEARMSATLAVEVAPRAEAGATLAAGPASGAEDGWIPLALRFATPDADGSEALAPELRVEGMPPGARLSHGAELAPGVWAVPTAALLAGAVSVRPPADSDADFVLTLVATLEDRASGAVDVRTLSAAARVEVAAVADAPVVAAAAASGAEDTAIPLAISATLSDLDGSESLARFVVAGLPEGASLTAGTRNADGTWTLTPAEAGAVALLPPANFSGTLSLAITAVSREGANGVEAASAPTALTVQVAPVADGAAMSAPPAAGLEDGMVALAVQFGALADPSESWDATALVSGLPAGAALSEGESLGGGAWRVDQARLAAGLVGFLPASNSDGDATLTITARVWDGAAHRDVSSALSIEVRAVADAPLAAAAGAAGTEDAWIPLALSAALADTDGSEALSLAVLGLPAGAALSAGARQPDGSWAVAVADLPGLALRAAPDWSGTLNLTLRATATEREGGDAAVVSHPFAVTVTPMADAPVVAARAASGNEDTAIALPISATLTDIDGSESIARFVVAGVPAGASLTAGLRNADGTWTLTSAEAANVSLVPPENYSGTLNLTVTAVSREGANGAEASASAPLAVTVAPVADAAVVAARTAAGNEDTLIALPISAALSDTDGSESIARFVVAGVPAGASLTAGTRNVDGTWTLTPAEAASVSLLPPANYSGTLSLTVTAVSREGVNGAEASASAPLAVTVAPVADAAVITARTAAGSEDTRIALPISAALSDTDGSESIARFVVAGVPEGASLTAGTRNVDGTWTLTPAQAAAVSLLPPENYSGTLNLTVTAVSREGANGSEAIASAPLSVTVVPVADVAMVAARTAAGHEDTLIALPISAALSDTDGSETIARFVVAGVPAGALLTAGTRSADGTWTLTPAQAAAVSLRPPPDFSGTVNLTVTAVSREGANGAEASASAPLSITVAPVADAALLFASGAGQEDTWIALRGRVAVADTDGSETLGPTLTVRDMPQGALLSHGAMVSPGVWEVPRGVFEAGLLALRPPADSDADITLRLSVETQDGASLRTTTASATLVVRAVADAPTVQVADARGREDQPIRLAGLGGALADTDGSEALSFVLSGVPAGASLTAGARQADGTWRLTPGEVAGVSLTPPPNFSGTLALSLAAVATEARDGAAPALRSAAFQVVVEPVADAGLIRGAETGDEDSWITLRPTFSTPDGDGSETWSALTRVSGVPAGALLSHGAAVAPGVWDVATEDLRAGRVALRPPADRDDDVALTLHATLTDTGAGLAVSREVSGGVSVTVRAVADLPTAAARDVEGFEDRPIALAIAGALADTDGSETLSARILGMPAGASLSAGTRNPDGSWSVPPTALDGLVLTPPPDFSGTIRLTLRATTTEAHDGSVASVERGFAVTVHAVADAPGLRTGPALGFEDSAIALRMSGWTTDIDGSEALLGFRIEGLPPGAVLRAGGAALARAADGSVFVAAAEARTLSVTPPPNSDADFDLAVRAVSAEPNGSRAESAPQTLHVHVDAVADAPVWLRVGAAGTEDLPVPLGLAAALGDTDGSESLFYVVRGLPPGFTLSAGTFREAGVWSLTAPEAAGVSLHAPRDFAGTVTLSVVAVAQEGENGSESRTAVAFPVRIAGVVDSFSWSAGASGAEDRPIALNLAPALRDADGSERLVGNAAISGIPEGAVLRLADGSAVPVSGGAASVAVARLPGLTLTLPRDSDGAATLAVTLTVEEADGTRATISGSVTVDAVGVADAPWVGAADARNAGHGSDDPSVGWIGLQTKAALADTDGSERLELLLRGVPEGFALSAGCPVAGGLWLLTPRELEGLAIRPPAGFEGPVKLRLQALAIEREGDVARAETTFLVQVDPDRTGGGSGEDGGQGGGKGEGPKAEAPVLRAAAEAGQEDAYARLSIRVGSQDGEADRKVTSERVADGSVHDRAKMSMLVAEVDGGDREITAGQVAHVSDAERERLGMHAAEVPEGGRETIGVRVAGVPSGGRLSAGLLDPETGDWLLRPEDLRDLRVVAPPDFAGEVVLTVTATAVTATGGRAETCQRLAVTFEAVADGASIGGGPAPGAEDGAIPLNLLLAAADRDGSEAVSAITVSGLPAGASLVPAAGLTDNRDGTWSATPAAAAALRFLPPPDAHGSFSLTVAVTTREASNGATATSTRRVPIEVAPVADMPLASARDAAGGEDSAIALNLSAALADADGSELLSLAVAGMPAGARLSAGINNGDGSWTLKATQLAGLTLTPPGDWSGEMRLTLVAHAMEASTGQVATAIVPFRVAVAGVADAPLADVAPWAAGAEDTAIAVDVTARLSDLDGSETLEVVIAGVPAGAVFNAGARNPDGTWTIPGAALPGLALTPPANFSGGFTLDIAVVAREAAGGSSETRRFAMPVTVDAVADAPVIAARTAAGNEDTAVALPISAALSDTDGSESIARFVVAGVPAGASLTAGTRNADGTWTLTPAEAAAVSLLPPANYSGTLSLTVTAVSREGGNGSEASASAPLSVTVAAVADAPILAARTASANEDAAIVLPISATLTDIDGSESIARFVVAGVPAGASLTAGTRNGDGTWTLTPAQAAAVSLVPPENYSGTLNLTVTAVSREGANGAEASATAPLSVTVAPVADAPVIAARTASGAEDTAIVLPISAALTDTDGSESIARFVVAGVPAGASLTAGMRNADGTWTLTPAQAAAVSLVPPENYSGTLNLTVTAVSREGANGAEASTTAPLTVAVAAVADAPILAAANASGTEDNTVALNLAAGLSDTDGSEALGPVLIGGLPAGFALSAGSAAGGGAWQVSPAQLPGLRLLPPADWNGTLTLTVQATAQDGASSATTSRAFSVTIAPVNDAPTLALAAAGPAAAGQGAAAALGGAVLADADSEAMGGATITLSGAAPGDRLAFAGHTLATSGGRTLLGATGLEVAVSGDTVTLSGSAPRATYEAVLSSLALENAGAEGLASGTRGIAIVLRDSGGAAAAAQSVSLAVEPSVILGDGTARSLPGTAGHDTFRGSAADEFMLGGAGADVFEVAAGGGADVVSGGGGSWLDTVSVAGGVAPGGAGGWSLALDAGVTATQTGEAFDLSQPASGQITFADGSTVAFSDIERITW